MMIWLLLLLPFAFSSKIVCPGGQHICSDSSTCCQLPNLSYGCCPLKNAVCCDDHVHCCPQGTTCDIGMCIGSNSSVNSSNSPNVCPGGAYTCPDSSTCCADQKGAVYGCCLLPDAVCCADFEHCCPKDTKCDTAQARCVGKDYELQMFDARKNVGLKTKTTPKFMKKPLLPLYGNRQPSQTDIICDGGSFRCPDTYTCCELPNLEWGCCPFSGATCCSDKLHCCPHGLKCDVTSKLCMQGAKNVTWSANIPALRNP